MSGIDHFLWMRYFFNISEATLKWLKLIWVEVIVGRFYRNFFKFSKKSMCDFVACLSTDKNTHFGTTLNGSVSAFPWILLLSAKISSSELKFRPVSQNCKAGLVFTERQICTYELPNEQKNFQKICNESTLESVGSEREMI